MSERANHIPFNRPSVVGREEVYLKQAIENACLSGNGLFTQKCQAWLEEQLDVQKCLLTTSCTHALEMTAILAEIRPGDEVIMASFAFPSCANAFALMGAKIVFIDIRPDTMNLDETLIEAAITKNTKAILVMHYAGVACEMEPILKLAEKHQLIVIEDAAHGMMSKYQRKYLGTLGHMGTFSFHETKNYTCGEGGALLLSEKRLVERAEIIREKGTDRSKFFRGEVDKYTWVDIGSSYVPSELNAAFLLGQLEQAEEIRITRLKHWRKYYEGLTPLAEKRLLELPVIPENCEHNAHIFYLKAKDLDERTRLLEYLNQKHSINAVFHYQPLHLSKAGKRFGRFHGEDVYTTRESDRLLRMPLFYALTADQIERGIEAVGQFYGP